MIGYKITAKNERLKYRRIYDGWFEGSPRLESKAKEIAAKQVVKQIMKQGAQFVVGGPPELLSKSPISFQNLSKDSAPRPGNS
jgi:hypothetical protein